MTATDLLTLFARVRRAVLTGRGSTDPSVRAAVVAAAAGAARGAASAAAASGAGASSPSTALPDPWADYVAKVRDRSSQITDEDVDALKAAGHSEDEVFDITVAAALGAALRSLEAGLDAAGLDPPPDS